MPSTSELSVEELRVKSERSREALASTVGELRDTVGDTCVYRKLNSDVMVMKSAEERM